MTHSHRDALDEAQRMQMAGLVLLDRVMTTPRGFHAALLEEEDDAVLDTVFKYLVSEGLVDIAEDDFYVATSKGRQAYQDMIHMQQSYLAHFDVFSRVDLGEGAFADPERDYLDDPRWSDLRVCVAEYKGIDPYRMVFLAQLSDEQFFENPDWKFDLALGSSFFTEMEEVVKSQIVLEELAYEIEGGEVVPGDEVIEDVILQGARINQERRDRELSRQQENFGWEGGNGEDEDEEDWTLQPYNPGEALNAYMGSPRFVEPMWKKPLWPR